MLKEISCKRLSRTQSLLITSFLFMSNAHAAMENFVKHDVQQQKLPPTDQIMPESSSNKGHLPFNSLTTIDKTKNSFDDLVWSVPGHETPKFVEHHSLLLQNPDAFDSSVWRKADKKTESSLDDFDKQVWSKSEKPLTRLRKDVIEKRSLIVDSPNNDVISYVSDSHEATDGHVVSPRNNQHYRDHYTNDHHYSNRGGKGGKGKKDKKHSEGKGKKYHGSGKKGKGNGGSHTLTSQHDKPSKPKNNKPNKPNKSKSNNKSNHDKAKNNKVHNDFSMSLSMSYDYGVSDDYDYDSGNVVLSKDQDDDDDDWGSSGYSVHDSMSYSMSYSYSYPTGTNDDYDYVEPPYRPFTLTCPAFNEIDNDKINDEILLWHYAIEHENGDVVEIIRSIEKEIVKLVFGEINDCNDLRRARKLFNVRVENNESRALQDSSAKVIGASSSPEDSVSGDICDPTVNNAECVVVNGSMKLFIAIMSRRRLAYSIEALDIIKDACNGGDLVSSPNTPNEFRKCKYLDDNRGQGTAVQVQEKEDDGVPIAVIASAACAASLLLLLLLLLVRRRRNNVDDAYSYSMKDDETHETDTSASTKKRLAHVLVDESDQLPDLNRSLDDIPEDDMVVYEEPRYGNLGGVHSALNVHRCSSGTCAECRRATKINFICTPTGRFDRDEMGEI